VGEAGRRAACPERGPSVRSRRGVCLYEGCC
jgi:hypothetical protein